MLAETKYGVFKGPSLPKLIGVLTQMSVAMFGTLDHTHA